MDAAGVSADGFNSGTSMAPLASHALYVTTALRSAREGKG